MPRLIDTNTRTDELAHVLSGLIAESGLDAPSSRRIAAGIPISIGTLYGHYESRERLLRVLTYRIGLALLGSISDDIPRCGPDALIRSDEDGLLLTRAWLGVVELGRCHEQVALTVAEIQGRERSLLRTMIDTPAPEPEELELVLALLHGLRTAVSRQTEPVDVETARRLVRRQVAQLARPAA